MSNSPTQLSIAINTSDALTAAQVPGRLRAQFVVRLMNGRYRNGVLANDEDGVVS
ncbi:hypothetical protein [Mesorhizobium sp. SARCC-RB16n]|uniref:hypothetical protein n=1 Tax=Mesorhizobium sp. SARCC-RB16n TaxID=2116687 RepID=UPI001668BC16|nr:hypothetical protein [Mesorhizobium sp. SARCC-RB16n]